jgi:hypothetical protein
MPRDALPSLGSDTPPEECGGGLPMLDGEARFLPRLPRMPVPKGWITKEHPSYKKDVILLNPYIYRSAIVEGLKYAKDKYNDLQNEASYRMSNLSENLINEAANRHLSK